MANIYKILDKTSTTTMVESLKNALVEKYGDGVTIHYQNAQYLIFSCPQINEKVIKFMASDTTTVKIYYGDTYTSGTSVENQIQFINTDGYLTAIHVVLGDSFIFMAINASNTSYKSFTVVIGKTKNNRSVCFGALGYHANASNCTAKDVTNNREIDFLCFEGILYSGDYTPFITPLILKDYNTNIVLKQADGTPDTIEGLYMSCYNGGLRIGEHSLFSGNDLYSINNNKTRLATSLMAEF